MDALIASATARRPDGAVFILPRADGQYSHHATDVIALLEEVGVSVDYATDPMASGVHAEKSAELVLPPLVILFSDATTLASALDGVTFVVRWFLEHRPGGRVSVKVDLQRGTDGSSRRRVAIESATADEAERLLRAVGRLEPPR